MEKLYCIFECACVSAYVFIIGFLQVTLVFGIVFLLDFILYSLTKKSILKQFIRFFKYLDKISR